jgi:flagellar protein FlgJ
MAEPDLESLSARVKAGDPAAVPALARQFESVFLSQLLKEMRQTLTEGEGGGMFGNDPGDALGGIFDMMMGRYIAGAGGIGLANVFSRQMARSLPSKANPENAPCDQIRKKYRMPS